MIVLAVATVGAALAPSLEVLIAFRVLQGVAGSVFPLTFGIVREQLPPERVGFGIGVVSAIFGIGSGFGYVMSGVVLELLTGAGCSCLRSSRCPRDRARAAPARVAELAPGRPDWLGGLLLAVGLLALLVGLTEGKEWGWTSPAVLGLFAGGLLFLAIWTRRRAADRDPMVDLDVLRRPAIALLSFSTFLIGYAMFAVYTIMPTSWPPIPAETGYGFSASPIEIGLFLLPVALAMLVSGPPAGGARRITPINVLRLGIVALTVSLALIAFAHDDRWMLYVWLALLGIGTGVPRRARAAGGRGGPSRPDRNRGRHQHAHAHRRRRCCSPGQRRDRGRLRSPTASWPRTGTRSPSASPRSVALPRSCRRSRWLARRSAARPLSRSTNRPTVCHKLRPPTRGERMKFGLLFRVQDPPNAEHIVDRWQEALETAKVAEESGFDGVFLPEHHMMPDGYLPSQWPVLGALAAVTERLEIGTTVHLLPFEHPIHMAEHGAMVDILSNGRLRLGVGMANFPEEFELFGLNPKRRSRASRRASRSSSAPGRARRSTSRASTSRSRATSRPSRWARSSGSARCPSPACAAPRASAPAGRPTRCTTSTS